MIGSAGTPEAACKFNPHLNSVSLGTKGYKGIAAAAVVALALRRVAIDKMPVEHRVVKASNFMLQQKNTPAAVGLDNRLKSKLVIAHIFGDQVTALKKMIRPRKVRHIDGDMMTVVRRDRLFRFAKTEGLITPNLDMRHSIGGISFDISGRFKYVPVKTGDGRCRSFGHGELNSGKSLRHLA